MSQLDPTLDRLLDQLFDEDARKRRNAAKELGRIGNPEAIADLVNVYNKDTDAGVRKAAGDALHSFRRIEQKMVKGEAAESSGPNLTPILSRVRVGLVVLLLITVVANIGFIVASIAGSSASTPTPQANLAAPSSRTDLVAAMKTRLKAMSDEATSLRKAYSVVQGMGVQGMDQNLCQQLPTQELSPVTLAPIDTITYPDLKHVNDLLNVPIKNLEDLRNTYILICPVKDSSAFNTDMAPAGGPAAFVAEADDVITKYLPAAQTALDNVVNHPAATVGPTFTPTTAPSPTVPTNTPTFTPTFTPTAAVTATSAVALNSTAGPASAAATEPGTEAAAFTLSGLHLDGEPTYKYHVSITTSGTYTSGRTFRGSLDYRVSAKRSPFVAEYDVQINEGSSTNAFFKAFAGPLYVAGESTYVVIDGVLYQYGSVVSTKSSNTCQAFNVTPTNTAKLQDISISSFSSIPLAQAGESHVINGELATHYVGKGQTGNNNELDQNLEVYVSKDNVPVEITMTETINPTVAKSPKALAAFGLKTFSLNFQYDLEGTNIALDVTKPAVCDSVKPK